MAPANTNIDLRDVDMAILRELAEGRCTRRFLADQLGYTGEYVYQRVKRLIEHGYIEIIHDGFYRLADDADIYPLLAGIDWDDVQDDLELTDEERDAVAAVFNIVGERGRVQKHEIVDEVWNHQDLKAGKASDDGDYWWRELIVPVLVADLKVVEVENGVMTLREN